MTAPASPHRSADLSREGPDWAALGALPTRCCGEDSCQIDGVLKPHRVAGVRAREHRDTVAGLGLRVGVGQRTAPNFLVVLSCFTNQCSGISVAK